MNCSVLDNDEEVRFDQGTVVGTAEGSPGSSFQVGSYEEKRQKNTDSSSERQKVVVAAAELTETDAEAWGTSLSL